MSSWRAETSGTPLAGFRHQDFHGVTLGSWRRNLTWMGAAVTPEGEILVAVSRMPTRAGVLEKLKGEVESMNVKRKTTTVRKPELRCARGKAGGHPVILCFEGEEHALNKAAKRLLKPKSRRRP